MTNTIAELVHARGGVVRVRRLADAGFSRDRIARAVARGEVFRVRKGWVALPSADRHLVAAARRLCEEASPWSDSGLESFVPPRLRWLNVPIRQQAWIAGRRVDFLIGDRLVFQIDGGHHVGAQREADIEHDAQLMLLGYRVIRVGYAQVVDRWHTVQDQIMRAIAQGLHTAA